VAALTRKLANAKGTSLTIRATTDQQEAISGADYVVSTFRQGGFEARHLDEAIPLQYDIIGQETIGPGGFFFAMRTLPVIRTILQDMKSYAPGAMLVNYTNPTQIVAEAVNQFSIIPCVSICDQTLADVRNLLAAMDMPEAGFKIMSIGFNHATWSTAFEISGEDGIGVMNKHYDTVMCKNDVSNRIKRQFQLAREFGRLPNSYLQYYYFEAETLAEARAKKKTRAEVIMSEIPGYYAYFREQAQAQHPQLSHVRGGSVFGDMAVEVLSSLIERDGRIHILNIPNHSAIPDFDRERIVEVPARISEHGIIPIAQPHLPVEVRGLLKMLGEYQWAAAKAIWKGNRRDLVHALAANPLVRSLPVAQKLLEHMLPLLRPYLPPGISMGWLDK
jgi:6-phospho-beta-glucosidase